MKDTFHQHQSISWFQRDIAAFSSIDRLIKYVLHQIFTTKISIDFDRVVVLEGRECLEIDKLILFSIIFPAAKC